jgi:hypothetical protein
MGRMDTCPDCKVELPHSEGLTHEYLGGNAACWKAFGDVLAREYNDFQYMKFHRWTVDAYAAQHPGKSEPRTIQSVHVHLLALYLQIERKTDPSFISKVMQKVTQAKKGKLQWLNPPAGLGEITIAQVLEASSAHEHGAKVEAWGKCVWDAWKEHHSIIRALAGEFL